MPGIDARAWPIACQVTCEENNFFISVLAAIAASTTLTGAVALANLPATCYDSSSTTASSHPTLASSSSVGTTCASQLLTGSGAGVAVLVLVVISSFVLVLSGLSLTRLKGYWSDFASRAIGNSAVKHYLHTGRAMKSDSRALTLYSYFLVCTSLALCCIFSLTDVGQFNCQLRVKVGSGPNPDKASCDYHCLVLLSWPSILQGISAVVWFFSALLMKHLESSFDRDIAEYIPCAPSRATPPLWICQFCSNLPSILSELLFSFLRYCCTVPSGEPMTLPMLDSSTFDLLALQEKRTKMRGVVTPSLGLTPVPLAVSSVEVQIQQLVDEKVTIIFTANFELSPRVGTFKIIRGFFVLLDSSDPYASDRNATPPIRRGEGVLIFLL